MWLRTTFFAKNRAGNIIVINLTDLYGTGDRLCGTGDRPACCGQGTVAPTMMPPVGATVSVARLPHSDISAPTKVQKIFANLFTVP